MGSDGTSVVKASPYFLSLSDSSLLVDLGSAQGKGVLCQVLGKLSFSLVVVVCEGVGD